ncbi:MAG: hypothetical protein WB347_05515 [Terriglobales bacterium]
MLNVDRRVKRTCETAMRHIPAFGIVAGSSSGQKVDWTAAFFDGREIAKVGNTRVSMSQQRGAKRIDLGKPCRPESQWLPCHGHSLNARTYAAVSHENPSWRLAERLQGGVTT